LGGFDNAKQVFLSGTFNGWREDELFLKKTETGWELPYIIGPGNYEYKYLVDGKWMADPGNPLTAGNGNSFLIIQPNYTFRLKGASQAGAVFLAGDFNNWKPDQLAMKKEGDDWVFPIHLFAGKVRYKFIVDGKWILDPNNKQWEQNEYRTGNSVIWIEN
jgi:1,4-alpha-glucan branching enzyme